MDAPIRSGTADDAKAIAVLLRNSIVELCEADHGGDEAVLNSWLQNKNDASVRQWLNAPDCSTLVAEYHDGLAGTGMIGRNGEILLLYVGPQATRRGIGSRLLNALLEVADGWGLRAVHSRSTVTARAFYLRHGFEPAGAPIHQAGVVEYPVGLVLSSGDTRERKPN